MMKTSQVIGRRSRMSLESVTPATRGVIRSVGMVSFSPLFFFVSFSCFFLFVFFTYLPTFVISSEQSSRPLSWVTLTTTAAPQPPSLPPVRPVNPSAPPGFPPSYIHPGTIRGQRHHRPRRRPPVQPYPLPSPRRRPPIPRLPPFASSSSSRLPPVGSAGRRPTLSLSSFMSAPVSGAPPGEEDQRVPSLPSSPSPTPVSPLSPTARGGSLVSSPSASSSPSPLPSRGEGLASIASLLSSLRRGRYSAEQAVPSVETGSPPSTSSTPLSPLGPLPSTSSSYSRRPSASSIGPSRPRSTRREGEASALRTAPGFSHPRISSSLASSSSSSRSLPPREPLGPSRHFRFPPASPPPAPPPPRLGLPGAGGQPEPISFTDELNLVAQSTAWHEAGGSSGQMPVAAFPELLDPVVFPTMAALPYRSLVLADPRLPPDQRVPSRPVIAQGNSVLPPALMRHPLDQRGVPILPPSTPIFTVTTPRLRSLAFDRAVPDTVRRPRSPSSPPPSPPPRPPSPSSPNEVIPRFQD